MPVCSDYVLQNGVEISTDILQALPQTIAMKKKKKTAHKRNTFSRHVIFFYNCLQLEE